MLNRVAYVSKCFDTTVAQALEDGYTTFIDPSYQGSTLVFSTEMSTNDILIERSIARRTDVFGGGDFVLVCLRLQSAPAFDSAKAPRYYESTRFK
jgi:hypothetical protein